MRDDEISQIIGNPEWLPHRYDRVTDRIQFRHVPRLEHPNIPFLTDEYIGHTPLHVGRRSEAMALAPQGDIHFIFHSAFCASTLLVRALDLSGMAMGLSEPVILNDIVGIRRRGEATPPETAQLLGDAMTLLARPFGPQEAVIVKPSNILNTLAGAMLAIRPQAKAILLYAPLDVFLASVARKGLWCRLWVRQLLEGFLREGAVNLGFEAQDYFRMSDLQVAAVGWLTQKQIFAQLEHNYGAQRIYSLNSETLLDGLDEQLPTIARHFGLIVKDKDQLIHHNPALRRHSKSGTDFAVEARRAEQIAARQAHQDEIEKVILWSEVIAKNIGLSLD